MCRETRKGCGCICLWWESTRLWRKKFTAPAVRAVRTLSGTRLVLRRRYLSRGDSLAPFCQRLANSSSCNIQPHARLCQQLPTSPSSLFLSLTQVLPTQLSRHALTHVLAPSDVLSFSIPTTQPTTATPAAKLLMLEMTAIFQPILLSCHPVPPPSHRHFQPDLGC